MRQKLRRSLLAVGAVVILIVTGVLCSEYLAFNREIGSVFARMRSAERHATPSFAKAFHRVHPNGLEPHLIMRIRGTERTKAEGHLVTASRELLWAKFLRLRYSDQDLADAHAMTLVFESGTGLERASRFYFEKEAVSLTYEECLAIVVMDISPNRFSLREHPDRLAAEVAKYS